MFTQFDEKNAPQGSIPFLEKTKESFGMIPNLERTMAAEPALLASYTFAWAEFAKTDLNEIEQQVVYQVVNFENQCDYCVPWHTLLSKQAGMDDKDIESLRIGRTLSDAKLEALAKFTRLLLLNRGKITLVQLEEFFEAGYEHRHALAVLLGISIKTMSNFTNSIAQTPLDKQVASLKWEKPILSMRP